ncbi:MAG: DNA repair exonuclease [Gemmatimonadaceae bacterium]|nr:DNA repair exonuclease [Gemmatimonadaceae bacterium]
MRLVHLADLHLGFRQYQRLTRRGINQREADIAGTFRRAIDQVIALEPELVLIAGDVFHTVRPSNPTIVHAYQQLVRVRMALPRTEVVMVAGNHDAPRTAETGCILELFAELGVHVADRGAERFVLPTLDCAVLAVPDLPGVERPPLRPAGPERHQVLLLHGEVQGALPVHGGTADRASLEITRTELGAEHFAYVALGHYHVHRQVAPNAWYAGSLDYTSTNPWGELREEREARVPGKGFVERDLATGAHTFHPVAPSRPLHDLEPIDASEMSARDLDAAIAARIATVPGGIEEAIVRLVVTNLPRHVVGDLDHRALREIRRQALNFRLDTREPAPLEAQRTASGAPARKRSLPHLLRERLDTRPLPPDVPRAPFVATGLAYLEQASQGLAALADDTE